MVEPGSRPLVKLAVVSNEAQLARLEKRFRLEELSLWCGRTSFQEVLRKRGIAFKVLDEFLLEDEWAEINAWGCGRAAAWIQFSRDRGLFRDLEFSSILNHRFSYFLIHLLKSYRYACRLMEHSEVSSFVIFRSLEAPPYPRYSTHFFVNSFLDELCREKGADIETIDTGESEGQVVPTPYRQSLKAWVRRLVGRVYGRVTGPPSRGLQVLAVGSLKRLGSILEALQAKGFHAVLYDHSFQFETYRNARRLKIAYLVPESIGRERRVSRESFVERYQAEILDALSRASAEGLFQYQNVDFGSFLERYFLGDARFRNYLEQCAEQANRYEDLLGKVKALGLVSDEDVTDKGSFLAGYFKWKGVPRFCISHANMTVNFAVPESHQA